MNEDPRIVRWIVGVERWLWAFLACFLSYTSGCVTGVYVSPRAQMAETQAYAYGLDIQARSKYSAQIAQAEAGFRDLANALKLQILTLQRDHETALHGAAATLEKARVEAVTRLEHERKQYSAQIVGLRMQLEANGIRERIITP